MFAECFEFIKHWITDLIVYPSKKKTNQIRNNLKHWATMRFNVLALAAATQLEK